MRRRLIDKDRRQRQAVGHLNPPRRSPAFAALPSLAQRVQPFLALLTSPTPQHHNITRSRLHQFHSTKILKSLTPSSQLHPRLLDPCKQIPLSLLKTYLPQAPSSSLTLITISTPRQQVGFQSRSGCSHSLNKTIKRTRICV